MRVFSLKNEKKYRRFWIAWSLRIRDWRCLQFLLLFLFFYYFFFGFIKTDWKGSSWKQTATKNADLAWSFSSNRKFKPSYSNGNGKRQFHYWTKQDNRTARVAHILQSKLNLKQNKKMSFRRQREPASTVNHSFPISSSQSLIQMPLS